MARMFRWQHFASQRKTARGSALEFDGSISGMPSDTRCEWPKSPEYGTTVAALATVEVSQANGGGGANTLTGDVISQTFLGPVTRLKVVGPAADLIADVSTAKAATLPIGMKVTAALPATDARVLELSGSVADRVPELDPVGP